jgi:hypothetical protein
MTGYGRVGAAENRGLHPPANGRGPEVSRTKGRPLRTGGRVFTSVNDGEPGFSPSSRIIPGMAVGPGHHDAVRELRTEPRARFLLAGERLELDIFVAGIFGKAPQAGVKGFCGVHAGEWGRAGRSVAEGGGPACSDQGERTGECRTPFPEY